MDDQFAVIASEQRWALHQLHDELGKLQKQIRAVRAATRKVLNTKDAIRTSSKVVD